LKSPKKFAKLQKKMQTAKKLFPQRQTADSTCKVIKKVFFCFFTPMIKIIG